MKEAIIILVIVFIIVMALWWIMTGRIIQRQYKEIQKAKEEAKSANSAKTRFLANISQELLTPINTIMGMDEMIFREDAKDIPKPYYMSMINYALDIRRASESLLGLVGGLLEMSRIEAGGMKLAEEEYDTRELFITVVRMIRLRSDSKGLTFKVSVDEILPERMYGDAGKIRQILINLLTDAVTYTDMGSVELSVSLEERRDDECDLKIRISDTGIGMKQGQLDKINEMLKRTDENESDSAFAEGPSIGISGAFARLMGGVLECSSVYGEGTSFTLTLSQKIINAAPVGDFSDKLAGRTRGPYVPQFVAPDGDVLIVDDDQMNLSVIKGLLKATGVFVTTAVNGEECLEKVSGKKYNVVLLGHVAGEKDSWDILEKIREKDAELPVYALTTNLAAGAEYYRSKGFTGFMVKPVDSMELESIIMKHLPETMMEKKAAETPEEEAARLRKRSNRDFLDTIDENIKTLRETYESGDMEGYARKVHSIGGSARIINARELMESCDAMEKAVSGADTAYVEANAEKLIADYLSYKEKLRGERADV